MARLNVLSTGGIVGRPVVDSRDATALGTIEDVIVDAETGRIAYVVLSIDPSYDDDRLYAVPWTAFTFRRDASELALDVPADRLRRAPAFARDAWPDFSDPVFGEKVYRFYNREPFWTRTTPLESTRYAASGYTRTETERVSSQGAAGSVGLLAAVVLLLLALGVVLYVLYPQETQQTANELERAADVVVDTTQNAATTARVKTALGLSKSVEAMDIDVDTTDGVVTLKGRVPSEEVKLIALAIAEDTSGVNRVVDQLIVDAEAAVSGDREVMSRRVSDIETRVRVGESIRNSPELEGEDVQVTVEGGVVTLSGEVASPMQRERAESIARAVEGVREVVNQIESRGPTL